MQIYSLSWREQTEKIQLINYLHIFGFSAMIVEFLSCKIWQISDKTILLIACKGMHLLIRSDKTFIRSYTIKILLIRSYTLKIPLIRSYTIKIPLIRSYTITIPLIRSYTIKILLIKSYTIKIPSYQILHDKILLLYKFVKYGLFFILKTIQSFSQVVAEKLQHATLVLEQQRKKYLILSFTTYNIL